MTDGRYDRIYAVVRRVPKGRVATYGQIAKLAGIPKNSRQVGTVLRSIPHGIEIPWYRIVKADLFILSLLGTTTFGFLWSLAQSQGAAFWTDLLLALFVIKPIAA